MTRTLTPSTLTVTISTLPTLTTLKRNPNGPYTPELHRLLTALLPAATAELTNNNVDPELHGNPLARFLEPKATTPHFIHLVNAIENAATAAAFTPEPEAVPEDEPQHTFHEGQRVRILGIDEDEHNHHGLIGTITDFANPDDPYPIGVEIRNLANPDDEEPTTHWYRPSDLEPA